MNRDRLDRVLVLRKMVRSRHEARQLIDAGRVTVNGMAITKAATLVTHNAEISVSPGPRFVSRGGFKLDAALHHFGLDVAGRQALDVGASTGGFTDCLLGRGATEVTAVDVGRGQFDVRLSKDQRVTLIEQTDIRNFKTRSFSLVVVDVSFISLCDLAPTLAGLTDKEGDLLVLMKPQFEVGRSLLGKGVVTGQSARDAALARVKGCLQAAGVDTVGVFASPWKGEHGNQEIFLWARKQG